MIKYLPLLLILTACGSGDTGLPELNTAQPLISQEQVDAGDQENITPTVDSPDVVVDGSPEYVPEEPNPIEPESSSEVEDEAGQEGETIPEPEPESGPVEVPDEPVVEPVALPIVDDIIEPVVEPVATPIKQLPAILNLEGYYDIEQEWRQIAGGSPQPRIAIEMYITWEVIADGVDIIIDGIYEATVVGEYRAHRNIPGELARVNVEDILPKVEIRAWIGDSEVIEEVIWL